MQNSRLITLLKALNPEEFRQFYRYIRTPFFTKSDDLLKLYEAIRKHYPHFDSPKLNKEKLFKHLYPKETFNDARLRNLMLKISKILEEYLLYLNFQQDEFQRKSTLTRIYRKRNLNVIFKQKTEDLLTDLDQQPYRDADYSFKKYKLQRDYYFHSGIVIQREKIDSLTGALHHLNDFYATERLRLGIELSNRARIFKEGHHFNPFHYEALHPKANKVYCLLLDIYNLLTSNDEALFASIKEQFISSLNLLNPSDAALILQALLNFSIQQFSKNEAHYLKEAFELYKIGLTQSILLHDKFFRKDSFLNITVIGSKLGYFEWVATFIDNYQAQLAPKSKSDIVTLSKCFLAFNKADYQLIPDELSDYQFKNPLYKINAKTILIRAYFKLFESDETYGDMVIYSCNAFEKFIKREATLNSQKKEPYLNFSFILKKIVLFKLKRLKMSNPDFAYLLNNFSSVFAKGWLNEIILNKE